MIGDQDSDIECGKAAGTETIIILESHSVGHRGYGGSDYRAKNIRDAVRIILRTPDKKRLA
jgi:phosphoglycolate phosphatase-like HAD superfamily hydrolase